MLLNATLLCLHLLAATLWIGGMAVMHFAVRPAAVQTLEPPLRLPFMAAALGRFFAAVSIAIVVLLGSGLLIINPPWQSEQAIATAMSALATRLNDTQASASVEWLVAEQR